MNTSSLNGAGRIRRILGEAAGSLLYHAEHGIVLTYEGLRRLAIRTDPNVRHSRRRLLGTSKGLPAASGHRGAVFVVYCPGPLPSFTKCFVESLARAGYSVVAVANTPLHPEASSFLTQHCEWIVHRENVGRDFGAYQDGIRFALERYPALERMILANDSVYYFPDKMDALIEALSSGNDLIGVSETTEHHYHIASFLMSFGPRVLQSDAFRSFWQNYVPIGTRRWAILRGEGVLSRDLLRAGFKPHILWPARALLEPLEALLPQRLEELLRLIPRVSRSELYDEWGLQAPAKNERFLPFPYVAQATRNLPASTLARQFVERIEAHNQMHGGGTLFQRFLGMPFMKRDLVYREVFTFDEMNAFVEEMPQTLSAEIMQDMETKGHPSQLGFLNRALHRHSAI